MEELIKQAFLHVDVIGPHVQEGHYDLIGPNGEIILPSVWEKTVEPDWAITMHMWPMDKAPLRFHGPPGPNGHHPGHRMPVGGQRPGGGHPFPPGVRPPGMGPGGMRPGPPPPPGWPGRPPVPPGMGGGRPSGRGGIEVVDADPDLRRAKSKTKPKASGSFFGFGGPSKPTKKK